MVKFIAVCTVVGLAACTSEVSTGPNPPIGLTVLPPPNSVPPVTPPERTIMPSEDEYLSGGKEPVGWSASGVLNGNSTVGDVSLQASFPDADFYTIQFARSVPLDVLEAPVTIFTRAVIEWSVEGNTVRRLIDVNNGVTISGAGQAFRVVVKTVIPNPAFLPAPSDKDYVVSVNVTRGTRPSVERIPTYQPLDGSVLTFPLFTIAPSAGVSKSIPVDAGIISFQLAAWSSAVAGSANGRIEIIDSAGTVYAQYKLSEVIGGSFVPIPAGAARVRVHNDDAANPLNVAIAWGIDG